MCRCVALLVLPSCFSSRFLDGHEDKTFQLLHTAVSLRADTTRWAGLRFHNELDAAAEQGLRADRATEDRVVMDLSFCALCGCSPGCVRGFPAFDSVPEWQGVLSAVYLVTPYNAATFNGLQFFTAQLRERSLVVKAKQPMPMQTRRDRGRSKPPNGTQVFTGRNRFATQAGPWFFEAAHGMRQVFEMRLTSGDCLAWRCLHRCDLTYLDLDLQEPRGLLGCRNGL